MNGYLSTSEVYKDGSFREGPELPYEVGLHCMIAINETHAMMTGGQGSNITGVSQKYIRQNLNIVWLLPIDIL